MNQIAAYTKTAIGNIVPQLNEAFAAAENSEGEFSRTAAENFIILAGAPRDLPGIESILDSLAVSHPSRFFVAYNTEGSADISAEVAARCHGVSKSEHVCTEIVRLGIPPAQLPALPSVLRSLLLTGRSTCCYVYSSSVPQPLLLSVGALSEQVIFDSGDFGSLRTQVTTIMSFAGTPIDLRWISLAPWRGQIKDIFSRKGVVEVLNDLEHVTISSSSLTGKQFDPSSLLMAGWIVERLGLEVISFSNLGYSCRRRDGRTIVVALEPSDTSGYIGLKSVRFISRPRSLGAESTLTVARTSTSLLEAELVSKDGNIHITRPYEDDSRDALIARFFLIGESIRNYPGAYRTGALLERLQSEFIR